MNYRGYKCDPRYSESDQMYIGYIEDLETISAATMDDFITLYHNTVDDHLANRKGKRMGLWISLAVVAAFLGLAAATCPGKDKHVEVLTERMAYVALSQIDLEEYGIDGLEELGGLFGRGIVKLALKSRLIVEDYVIFSLGKIEDEGEEHVISFGIFGHIFSASREQMRKRLEQ